MRKIILCLLLFTFVAVAEETTGVTDATPKATMADLKPGDELLVTNDMETFASATFRELCFVLTPAGFQSFALLDNVTGEEANFVHTLLPDRTPLESVKMITGATCSLDGEYTFLVPKSQLFGLLTRLENIMTAVREREMVVADEAVLALKKDNVNVSKEISELRRLLNSL